MEDGQPADEPRHRPEGVAALLGDMHHGVQVQFVSLSSSVKSFGKFFDEETSAWLRTEIAVRCVLCGV